MSGNRRSTQDSPDAKGISRMSPAPGPGFVKLSWWSAPDAPGCAETAGWQPMAGQRSRVPLPGRHAVDASHVRREFRKGGRGGRARPPGVDPEGTTAQLRLADIRYWCPGRANSRLVGHSGTTTTEASTACRSDLSHRGVRTPCIRIFPSADSQALSSQHSERPPAKIASGL